MLVAVMLLPFASHAQSTVSSFPYTCGFETTDDATAWVFTNSANANHWIIGTATNAVSSGSQALYISNDNSSYAYSNSSNPGFSYATLTFEITSAVEVGVSFDWKCNGESTWDFLRAWIAPGVFTPTVGQNPTGATDRYQTGNPEGWYQIGSTLLNLSTDWNTASLNQSLAAGTYTVVLMWYNDNSGGSQPPAAIDNFTITATSCLSPTNLVASNITATSATLTWNGTATGYTLYEYANLDSAAFMYTTTTADLNTLEPNTVYTFGVTSDCGEEESAMTIVTFRTGCAAVSLPYTMGFEASDLVATTPNADALPFCWSRYASGTGSYTYFPYSYSSTSYAHGGSSRVLYFYDGTGASYPDTMVAILPELDVVTYPMNANRLTFWGRVSSGTNVKNVQIGTMTDPTDMSTFALVETVAVSGTTHTLYSVPLTTASATAPYLAIMLVKSSSGYLCIDDLTLEEMPSCLEISDLAAGNITASSVELTWSDAANAIATYTVYNMADTSVVATGVTGTTYTVTGLNANTDYTFGVAANCPAGDASVMTVSARTACAAMALPWSCGFEADEIQSTTAATALPWCSYRYMSATTSSTPYPYSYSSATNAHEGSRSLYFYGTTYSTYPDTMTFILPQLDVTTYPMNANRLTFWAKSSSASYDKTVYVGTLTDPTDPSTFALVDQVTVSGTTHTMYSVPLTSASATAPYVCVTVLKGSGSVYIDDMTLEELPSCLEVSSLAVTGKTTTSITLEWADAINPTATYTVYNMADTSVVATGISALTYTVTGLTANTNYLFGVAANCSANEESAIVTVDAFTGYCTPNPSSVDGQGITGVAFGDMTNTTSHPSAAPYYIDNTAMAGSVPAGTTASVEITYSTGSSTVYSYGTLIWVDWNNDLTFDDSEIVYTGMSAQGSGGVPEVLTATFDIPATTPLGSYRMRIAGADSYFDSYVNNGTGNHGSCFTSTYAVAEDYTLTVSAAPSCLAPAGLAATNITADGATLTWTGEATSYNVYAIGTDTTFLQVVTGTTLALTNLDAMTSYTYGVTSICGNDESDMATVTFTTACSAVALPWTETFAAADAACWTLVSNNTANASTSTSSSNYFGFTTFSDSTVIVFNSWSNATDYYQYAYSPILDATAMAGFDSIQVTFIYSSHGSVDPLRFGYSTTGGTTPDSYTWTSEYSTTGYTDWQTLTFNVPLNVVQLAINYTSTGCNYKAYVSNMAVTGYTIPSCPAPTGLTVDNIAADAATLTWTGEAASYNVYTIADGTPTFVQNVTATTLALTNLTPMTAYTYGVTSVCGSDESEMATVSFTTACSAIAIPYTEDFTATNPTLGCWSMSNVESSTGVTSDGTFRFYYTYYPPQYLISPELSGTDNGVKVSFLYKVSSNYYAESFQLGYSTTTNDTAAFTWGTEQANLTNQDWALYEEILPAGVKYVSVRSTAYDAFYLYIDSMVFNLPPACMPVTDLTVDSVTATSVFLSWNGTATSYKVYDATGTVLTTTANTSYEVTGLTAATGYTFGVTAVCGTDESPVVTVSATTDCAGGSCTVKIYATDGYGDGWSNSTLTLTQNGATVAAYTMANQYLYDTPIYDTFQVSVCSGVPVSFSWTSASSWDNEAGFQILDGNDTVLYTVTDASMLTDGAVFFTVDNACGSNIPTPPVLDSMKVTVAVNDATMGTTVPAPGVHYFHEGEVPSVVAVPNTGNYIESWTVYATMDYSALGLGIVPMVDTTINISVDEIFALIGFNDTLTAGCHLMEFSVTANFAAGTAPIDTLTMTFAVNDSTMGTTVPAPGTYQYTTGDTVFFEAIANPGYHFIGFVKTANGVSDTTLDATYASFFFPATVMMDYDSVTLTALFEAGNADSMQVNVSVNDTTMGTTVPAPGTHYFQVGETPSVVAVANDGYHLVGWTVQVTGYGQTFIDTTVNYAFDDVFEMFGYDEPLEASDMMLTWNVTANFAVGEAPVVHDSLTVITSVNDTTMGTITPAPGTHYYVVGDSLDLDVVPNDGYYLYALQLNLSHPLYGTLFDTVYTSVDELVEDNELGGLVEEFMMGYVITVNAIFQPNGHTPEVYTVTVNYDQTRGTVTGMGEYVEGTSACLTATAYNGYEFIAWVENGDTVSTHTAYTIDNIDRNHTLTAVFEPKTGIDDVEADNVTVTSNENVIFVRGAEGKTVVLFDVNGRMLSRVARAVETVEFRVANSGVYMVKVANAAAKRVVVIR